MGTVINTSSQNQSSSLQSFQNSVEVNPKALDDLDLFSVQKQNNQKLFPDTVKSAPKIETMETLTEKQEQQTKTNEPSFLRRVGEWIMSFWNPVRSIPVEPTAQSEIKESNIAVINKDKTVAGHSALYLKPEIEPAKALDERASFTLINQNLAFLNGIRKAEQENVEEDKERKISEIDVLRMFAASLARYKSIREAKGKFDNESVLFRLDAKDALHHESIDLEKERQNASNNSTIASWVNTGLSIFTMGGTVGMIAAVGLGATIPVVVPTLVALGTIGNGISLGLKNYYENIQEQKTSQILGNNVEHDVHEVMIGIEMDNVKNLLQYLTTHWKQKKEMEKSRFETARFR